MVMNMNTYAIIDATTTVINVVTWDGLPPWTPPQDCIAVEIPEGSNAGIGWTYVDGEFIAPTTSEVERPAPGPNYRGFYDGLLISTAYQNIRTQAVASLPLTLASVEFIAAMGDAKAGIPNEAALQACINNIAATATDLTEADWTEIGELLITHNLAAIYTLPS